MSFCSVKVPFKPSTRYLNLYCMLQYVLVFVNFIRNERLSDQVFRIGSKKTARQVEAIIQREIILLQVVIFIIIIIIIIMTIIILSVIIVMNISIFMIVIIIKNYNFLYCDRFKKLFSANSFAKLISDSLSSVSSISLSHLKLQFKSTNHNHSTIYPSSVSLLMQIFPFFHNLAILLFSEFVIFCDEFYNYRQNRTPLSPVTITFKHYCRIF